MVMGVTEAKKKYKDAMKDSGSRIPPRYDHLDKTLKARGRAANPAVHDKIRDGYEDGFGQFMGSDVSGSKPSEAWHDEFDTEEDRDDNAEKWEERMRKAFGT